MLNISQNQIHKKVDITKFTSGEKIFTKEYYKALNKFLLG